MDVMSILCIDIMSTLGASMAVPKSVITDAELQVLKILWAEGPWTAREITICRRWAPCT